MQGVVNDIITKHVGFDIWLVLYICTIYCTYDKASYSFEVEFTLAIMGLYRAYLTLTHLVVNFGLLFLSLVIFLLQNRNSEARIKSAAQV